MPIGRVVWFSGPKSFGFIKPDDGGADIFVHWTAITGMKGYKTLEADQKVSYEVISGPKGKPQAANVVIVD
jgi:CspA family cold shock protein